MKDNILQLIFRGTNAYLCKNKSFSLTELGLNNILSSFTNPAYWTVRVIETFPNEARIHVEILSYNSGTPKISEFQKEKQTELSKFNHLTFKSVDTVGVYSSANNKGNRSFEPKASNFIRVESNNPIIIDSNTQSQIDKPQSKNISEIFWVNFNDAQFMLGYVSFKKHIKEIDKIINFKIPNDHILSEFDNIKYWFSKKLKTKKFQVKAHITLVDHQVNELKATSKEIDLITPELIDSIKYLRTLELTKAPKEIGIDKSLFTAEDIFSQIDTDDIEGNVFKQSEKDILNFLTEKGNVRNKKELAYLSGKKQSENHPIRYTLYPNFGFLFLIEGAENNHFVWELLNSHATYIWTIDKSEKEIKLQFKRIESTVNLIRTMGREEYKRAYRNGNIDSDLVFKVIKHKDIGSNFIDEFPKWKDKLNEQLT